MRKFLSYAVILATVVGGMILWWSNPGVDPRSGWPRKTSDEEHIPWAGPGCWLVATNKAGAGEIIYQDGTRLPADGFNAHGYEKPPTDAQSAKLLQGVDPVDYPVIAFKSWPGPFDAVRRCRDGKLLKGAAKLTVTTFIDNRDGTVTRTLSNGLVERVPYDDLQTTSGVKDK